MAKLKFRRKKKPWRFGAVDIAFASGTEDPGSNPARVLGFLGSHSNTVVYNLLNMHCLCVCVEKYK
jgi:hypothetical protein